MTSANTPSVQDKLLSFSNLIITNTDAAFNLLRNGWPYNRLDQLPSWSVLLLDEKSRACGVIDLPLNNKMVTEYHARDLLALIARENAESFVLAQNKRYGVLLPTSHEHDFMTLVSEMGREQDRSLFDYFLINKLGYYSYNEEEYRVCPPPYLL